MLYAGFMYNSANGVENLEGVRGSTVVLPDAKGGGDQVAGCQNKAAGASCNSAGAKTAKCVTIKTNGTTKLSCAAKSCNEGYLLSLDSKGNSQGICHKIDYIKTKRCATLTKENCGEGQELVPFPRANPNDKEGDPYGAYNECFCANSEYAARWIK